MDLLTLTQIKQQLYYMDYVVAEFYCSFTAFFTMISMFSALWSHTFLSLRDICGFLGVAFFYFYSFFFLRCVHTSSICGRTARTIAD